MLLGVTVAVSMGAIKADLDNTIAILPVGAKELVGPYRYKTLPSLAPPFSIKSFKLIGNSKKVTVLAGGIDMKTLFKATAIAALAAPAVHAGDTLDPRIGEARTIVKTFATTLKGELQSAIRTGSIVEAVEVCHSRAPEIAKNLATEHGWQVGRTSLRRRNAGNAPDDWENTTLNRFEEQKAAGQAIENLEYATTVNRGGKATFRYMKAIPTQGLCLACHGGDSVSPEVELTLKKYYPDDLARGFKEGDIRGAFTLSKPD